MSGQLSTQSFVGGTARSAFRWFSRGWQDIVLLFLARGVVRWFGVGLRDVSSARRVKRCKQVHRATKLTFIARNVFRKIKCSGESPRCTNWYVWPASTSQEPLQRRHLTGRELVFFTKYGGQLLCKSEAVSLFLNSLTGSFCLEQCDYGTGIDNRKCVFDFRSPDANETDLFTSPLRHVSKDFVNALTKRNEDLTASLSTAEQEVARLTAALAEANHRLKSELGNDDDDHVGTGSKKRRTRDSRMGSEDDDEDHDVAEFAVDSEEDDGSGVAIMMDSLKVRLSSHLIRHRPTDSTTPYYQLIDNSGEVRSFGPTSSFSLFPDCKANEMPDPRAPLLGDSTPSREIYEYFRQGPQPPTDTWRMYLPAELPLTFELHESLLDHFEAFFAPWCAVRRGTSPSQESFALTAFRSPIRAGRQHASLSRRP